MENLKGDYLGRKYASPRCGGLQRLPGVKFSRLLFAERTAIGAVSRVGVLAGLSRFLRGTGVVNGGLLGSGFGHNLAKAIKQERPPMFPKRKDDLLAVLSVDS